MKERGFMITTGEPGFVPRRILYVEDENAIRDAMKEYFELIGHSVVLAEEGNSALKLFDSNNFDLIITDINMPNGMGGLEFIKKIIELNVDTPIIAISGYLNNIESVSLLPKDVAYCAKPISLKYLSEMIEEVTREKEPA